MEDLLAIGVVAAVVALIVYFVSKYLRQKAELAELEDRRQSLVDQLNANHTRDLERARGKVVEKPLHQESESDLAYMRESNMISKTEHDNAIRKKRTFVKREETTTPTVTTSNSSSNLLSDLADVAMIVNTVHHWNDNKPHMTNTDSPIDFPKERSVGVTSNESSWGFDDSDSRRSVSSSMDTSSSYSSSSSSSSSDSSSGPSSDW